MTSKIVVVGKGAIGPLGIDGGWERLVAGESGIDTITQFDPTKVPLYRPSKAHPGLLEPFEASLKTHIAGEVPEFSLTEFPYLENIGRKLDRKLDRVTRMSLAVGIQALS
ncbi:MAG: hypothetical protein ABIH34_00625, partial [Nanoarchaeota archaeon]